MLDDRSPLGCWLSHKMSAPALERLWPPKTVTSNLATQRAVLYTSCIAIPGDQLAVWRHYDGICVGNAVTQTKNQAAATNKGSLCHLLFAFILLRTNKCVRLKSMLVDEKLPNSLSNPPQG